MGDERDSATLCYVDGQFAYFTTRSDGKQWGDDWNDAPYEHNAGTPYEWRDYMAKRGIPRYEIHRVAWDGPFVTPDDGHLNSPWSVMDINDGKSPWLLPGWHSGAAPDPIPAGVTLAEFRRAMLDAGGTVYEPSPAPEGGGS